MPSFSDRQLKWLQRWVRQLEFGTLSPEEFRRHVCMESRLVVDGTSDDEAEQIANLIVARFAR